MLVYQRVTVAVIIVLNSPYTQSFTKLLKHRPDLNLLKIKDLPRPGSTYLKLLEISLILLLPNHSAVASTCPPKGSQSPQQSI